MCDVFHYTPGIYGGAYCYYTLCVVCMLCVWITYNRVEYTVCALLLPAYMVCSAEREHDVFRIFYTIFFIYYGLTDNCKIHFILVRFFIFSYFFVCLIVHLYGREHGLLLATIYRLGE